MKSKEVKIVKEVIPCDVLPVAKFSFERLPWTLPQMVQMKPKLWPSLGVRYKLMQDAHH